MRDTHLQLTLVGGPTVLLELEGLRLLTDPTFGDPGAYGSGAVTLTKVAGPALTRAEVGPIDAVLLSHDQHADNLDPAGRELLEGVPRVLTTEEGARRLPRAQGLAPWDRAALVGRDGRRWTVTATPARHGPRGIERLVGPVAGFVLTDDAGRDLLYVTGDTVWFEGVAEVARRFSPAVVMLFTGAARTRGAARLTMDANDALEAAHAFDPAAIVAVHNEGWAHFTEDRAGLAQAFDLVGQHGRLHLLEPGRRTALALPPAAPGRARHLNPPADPAHLS